jgi:uncharacterized membrane protein YbhN (UPF0104 family)
MFLALGVACVLIDSRVSLINVQYPLLLAAGTLLSVAIALSCWWLLHRRSRHRFIPATVLPKTGEGVIAKLRAVWHEVVRRGPAMIFRAAIPAGAQVILAGAAVELLAGSLGIHLSLLTSIWITAAVYAVVLLPISVAGVGVREVTLTKALGLLGVDSGLAVALSILLFADPIINALIGGALQLRSSIGSVQRQA